MLVSMPSQTQFGHTLLLSGFQADSTAKKLNRLHFLKNASSPAPYDDAWLQHLIMRHPSLLPVDQIEPAFNTLSADALLANETRKDGWVRAIADFQSAVMKASADD